MNKLVLCEGKTDAILLSYYLEKTCGWKYNANAPKGLKIKDDEIKGESVNWYSKGEDNLLICGVGGKDNFGRFYKKKIHAAIIDASAFSKMAVIIDHDDQSIQEISDRILDSFKPLIAVIENNEWKTNIYENSFKKENFIEFLLLVIPPDKVGALETLLIEAISENEYDAKIVKRNINYIKEIRPIADRYLAKKRLRLKACLGITWAIQYPEKLFSFIDEQIRTVKWEDSTILDKCFEQLKRI